MQRVSRLFGSSVVLIALVASCGGEEPTATSVPPTPIPVTPTATSVPPTATFTIDQQRDEEIRQAALDYLETVLFFQSAFEALVFEISAAGRTGFSVAFEDDLIDELIDAETAIETAHHSAFSLTSWSMQFEQIIVKGQKLVSIGLENVWYILDEISLETDEAQVLMADVLWAADESEVAAADFRKVVGR